MSKKRLIIVIVIILIMGLLLLTYLLTNGMERIKNVSAVLFVNGKRIEEPAIIYWYDYSALAEFPLFSTLEALGCQIKQDESGESLDTIIRVGEREFVVHQGKYSSDLYENGQIVCSDVARPCGKRWTGPLCMDGRNCEKVLTLLGYDHISFTINEEDRIIELTATQNSK